MKRDYCMWKETHKRGHHIKKEINTREKRPVHVIIRDPFNMYEEKTM